MQLAFAELLPKMNENAMIIAQSSFVSAVTERADIVLPMAIWSERDGSLTNTEGRVQKVTKAVNPK